MNDHRSTGHPAERAGVDRRRFLMTGGSVLAGFLAGCNSRGPDAARSALELAESVNEEVEAALFRHTSMDTPRASAREAGKRFRSYFISNTVPVWDRGRSGSWALEVGGMVQRPLRLTLDDLMRLPSVTHRVDHFCVEGWTAIARRTGVRVSELARLAGAADDARYVDFESFDKGYHESWDRASAMHPQTLVVYAQDGQALSPAYGAPARVFSPVKLGYKNTKYLTRVMFLPARTGGYWSDQGYEWFGGT
jgi:DMSO/TMAO reductase YedYZ molybdopterin-dependent catalytic subunit